MESSASSALLSTAPVTVGPVVLHVEHGCARVQGAPVWLTRREFAVLTFLAAHPAMPVAKHEIHRAVWGEPIAGFKDRSVDVHIVRLRRKLAAACPDFTYIHTHHNIGYRFDPEPVAPGVSS
ncbi:MAG TPA: helix-turn-helix domain-containing protein [Baekduia sp.]|nr:helix-turn-helix domain-containing protein [Baekduia sp.]